MRADLGVIICVIFACAYAGIAHAQAPAADQEPAANQDQAANPEQVTSKDRAALTQCLSNAKTTKSPAEGCIGVVQAPCLDAPGGQSTYGMKDCANREAMVWDEQLNEAYKAALAAFGDSDADGNGDKTIKGADLIRDMERAWLAFRSKKCAVASLQMAGGTGAGVLYNDCYLYETAHHAIWLNSLVAQ